MCALLFLLAWATSRAPTPVSASLETGAVIERRIGTQWQELERICPNRNYTSCTTIDPVAWSAAKDTRFVDFEFNGLGAWSTFSMLTFDVKGDRRTRGGDSWHVFLRDVRQHVRVPARVFDEGDGTYLIAALFLVPGDYNVVARLMYSDCQGLQEPLVDTDAYIKVLKKADHCYIGAVALHPHFANITQLLESQPAGANVPCTMKPPPPSTDKGVAAVVRMEHYWMMRNSSYQVVERCQRRFPPPARPVERLVIWGDSTVKEHWEHLMAMARHPCVVGGRPGGPRLEHGGHRLTWENFYPEFCPPVTSVVEADPPLDAATKKCTAGAPWTSVPIGTNTHYVSDYYPDAILFNMSAFAYNGSFAAAQNFTTTTGPVTAIGGSSSGSSGVLPREFSFVYFNGWGMIPTDVIAADLTTIRPGDVFIFNTGAHQQRDYMFAKWKVYVDTIAAFLKGVVDRTGAFVVWRSGFMMKEYVFRKKKHADGYVAAAHFNTEHRRLMFDSYAEWAMARAGVHIWDVTGLSSVGGHKSYDMVHVDFWSIRAMNLDMLDLFCG